MFGEDSFRGLISEFKTHGYDFRTFDDFAEERSIVLRHDIDFSVDLAHAMAQTEAELGVRATYFFMLSSNAYNLLSQHNRKLVREIKEMGHVTSLHFDPDIYADVDSGFMEECAAIAPVTGPVSIVSLHRPGDFLKDNNRPLPGARHTYEDRFFRHMKYVSDSGGAFSHGHPLETDAFNAGRSIHLLLHPIWWTTGVGCSSAKIREWQERHFAFLNGEASRNCKTFDGQCVNAGLRGVAA